MPKPPATHPAKLSLPRWQRRSAYATVGLVSLSGLGWLLAHYALSGEAESGEHPLAHWSLVVHGIGAYLLMMVAGSMTPVHVRVAWRLRRNRSTGLVMGSVLTLLASSGLWLYYGPIEGRDVASLLHWIIGLSLVPVLMLHIVIGRAARRAPAASTASTED